MIFFLRKNAVFTPILAFFADVSKKFTLTFPKNGSTDFPEIFTQVYYHYWGGPEPLTFMNVLFL